MRTGGQVRFLHVSAAWQKRIALIAGLVLFAWAGATVTVLVNQLLDADDRAAVAQQQAAATAAEARIAKYRDSVGETVADLDERQAQLEEWGSVYFGVEPGANAAETTDTGAATPAMPLKTSAIDPGLPLPAVQQRIVIRV